MEGGIIDERNPNTGFGRRSASKGSKANWKIAHEHDSVPFYMDGSFKASIDLTP
jgi:PhnB protein